jgi:hypothetical protein
MCAPRALNNRVAIRIAGNKIRSNGVVRRGVVKTGNKPWLPIGK